MNQVIEVYVDREVLMNPDRDCFDKRKMFQHDLVAYLLRDPGLLSYGHTGNRHGLLLFFGFLFGFRIHRPDSYRGATLVPS